MPQIVGSVISGQVAIAVTNTPVALGTGSLVNGVTVKANSSNTARIALGPTGLATGITGGGDGYILEPGQAVTLLINSLALLSIQGTAGDYVSFIGN